MMIKNVFKIGGKKKRSISTQTLEAINARLKKLMAERNIENELQLAQASGLHNTAIYRGFSGERPWNLDQLEIIARRALKVPLSALFQDPLVVPIVGTAKDGHGPPQESITNPKPIGYRAYQMDDMTDLARLYCLEVADNSMTPILRQGAHLIAQRDTADSIKQGDLVVFWDSDDRTLIRQINFDGEHIVLKSLTPEGADKVLPKRYLAACDRIRRIELPA
jgi:SOS-response transcriptional repressor LexA